MTTKYKNQTPIHLSQFLDELESGQKNYQVTFLGNMTNSNNELVDLYLLKYKNGETNPTYQFGDEEHQYGSGGDSMMYYHLAHNKNSEYTEIYKRSLSLGLMTEKTYLAGYSYSYDQEQVDNYNNTDYVKAIPKRLDYYSNENIKIMTDDELDDAIEAHDKAVKAYKVNYEYAVGKAPISPSRTHVHVFSDIEEAKKYCPLGTGRFKKFHAINDQHLDALVNVENFHQKIRFDENKIKDDEPTL